VTASRGRLLYASPFAPMRSGISDYSEKLIYAIRPYYDISLLIDDYQIENHRLYDDFNVKVYKKDLINFSEYPFRIYNIGNNPHYHAYMYDLALKYPGMVILHDFSLYYLTVGVYAGKSDFFSKVYTLGGQEALYEIKKAVKADLSLLDCKCLAPSYPLNAEILNSGNLIMVHSDLNHARVMRMVGDPCRVRKIEHIDLMDGNEVVIPRSELFRRYGIPLNGFIVSSFGFIDRTKLNDVIIDVIQTLNGTYNLNLFYVMVGEGNYADAFLSKEVIKTGFVTRQEFDSFVRHSDLVVNLRFPSMGETSGAIIRALGAGKVCIVSDDAWFAELPGDVVIKVDNAKVKAELIGKVLSCVEHPETFAAVGRAAREYIEKFHNPARVGAEIVSFMEQAAPRMGSDGTERVASSLSALAQGMSNDGSL